ncbi:MAG: lysophospholipid acyltransferase family protein [Kiloniellaceae bacterium]
MKLIGSWIKSEAAQRLFGRLIALLLWVLHVTVRWRREIAPETQALLDNGQPLLICLWHGRMLLLSGAWPRRPARLGVVTSAHRDGRLIARAASVFDYDTVLGSSRRGGTTALLGMSRLLRRGVPVVITPDGPKGPRMRLKAGAVKAAQITGAPLVAYSGSARPRKIFASWDRFCLPLPFARAVIRIGPPVYVPRDADPATLELCRQRLEDSLNALTNDAERALGQEEIQAAAPEDLPQRHASA